MAIFPRKPRRPGGRNAAPETSAPPAARPPAVGEALRERLREIAAAAVAPEDALEPALRAILEASRAQAGALCLFDQRHGILRLVAEVGFSEEGCRRLRNVRRTDPTAWDMPLNGLMNRRAYLIESAARNRYVPQLVENAAAVRTIACLPLHAGPTPVGSLVLVALAPRSFTERDVRTLERPLGDLAVMIEAVRRRGARGEPVEAPRAPVAAPPPSPLPRPAAAVTELQAEREQLRGEVAARAAERAVLAAELAARSGETDRLHAALELAAADRARLAADFEQAKRDAERAEMLAAALAAAERERARLAAALETAAAERAEWARAEGALEAARAAAERATASATAELAGARRRAPRGDGARAAPARGARVGERTRAPARRGGRARGARASAGSGGGGGGGDRRGRAAARGARLGAGDHAGARGRGRARDRGDRAPGGGRTGGERRAGPARDRPRRGPGARAGDHRAPGRPDARGGGPAREAGAGDRSGPRARRGHGHARRAPRVARRGARPRAREIEAGRRPLVVIDVEDRWNEKALDGHHVEVLPPADDLAEQIAELSPARIVVNLLAPGALGALVAARAAGCGARFWGCLANPGADRALMLGMVEAAESPIDPDDVVTTLERYAARGTRVVTVGADVDALMSLRQALARKGLSVSMAWDAKQAADLLQVVRPEVVVVDLALPRRDGYGIVARLAALDPPPSAILVPGPDDAAVAFAAALADSASAGGALQLGQLLAAVLARSEAPPIERRHKIRVVARK